LCEVQKHGFTPPEQIVNLGLFLKLINKAPTVEAKPVVHAHWIEEGEDLICSNCEEYALLNCECYSEYSKYCPYCGAQMDESISRGHENDNHIAGPGKKEE
jgi:hypothetical protein